MALLDTGSDRSYCAKRLVERLRMRGKPTSLFINTLTQGEQCNTTEADLEVRGINTQRAKCPISLPKRKPYHYLIHTLLHSSKYRSPIHMNNVEKDWFTQQPEIEILNWPSKGCDMNSIKNLWTMMCREWDVDDEVSCGVPLRERPGRCGNQ
ncbi:hypothetical protein Hamer_G002249 [Homarus americanus]|uniref:Peptidase aspartic putative domain-containing protein n=1 Tax=Homarus americanus TaxID=6706 RepID=A0A8J5JVT8_HOMAM|nr:hypothetical protein Hamer_G002249 [Homarus americanus]